MQHSLLINILQLLRGRDKKALALWEKAMPISIDELEARLTALTTKSDNEKPVAFPIDFGTQSFEELLAQLENLWEQMEDLDDCSVV